MPITLGSNISSLRAQRQLGKTSDKLETVFTRLSSGQRINTASDDAAGLAIADSLNAGARVYSQGVRNLSDGISVLNIADGALGELTNITFRLTELAEQAANGTLGITQRASLNEEAQALSDEYLRITKTTEFNGRKLFEGDYGELRLQAGYGVNASIGDGLGGSVGTGDFGSRINTNSDLTALILTSGDLTSGDFNGDGNLDLVTSGILTDNAVTYERYVQVYLGDGDGNFDPSQTFSSSSSVDAASVTTGDINGDGVTDFVVAGGETNAEAYLGKGDGTFEKIDTLTAPNSELDAQLRDLNSDGNLDLITSGLGAGSNLFVYLGEGDGTFGERAGYNVGGGAGSSFALADFNNDNILDVFVETLNGNDEIMLGVGDGTFTSSGSTLFNNVHFAEDLNGDGNVDLFGGSGDSLLRIYHGNGDGTFDNSITYDSGEGATRIANYGDIDSDGHLDVIGANGVVMLGSEDGSFASGIVNSHINGTISDLLDIDNDGVLDLLSRGVGTPDSVSFYNGVTTDGVAALLDFSLNNIADAKSALSRFSQKLDQLSEQRGQIGAFQSRVEIAENVLQSTSENYKAAESRIRDADIAQEAADLVRLQILQQASSSVLAQANQQPQLVLQLLSNAS